MNDLVSINTVSGFNFSAVPITDDLDNDEYMIGSVIVDGSSSMRGQEKNIEKLLKDTVEMCQKLPTRESIMFRADIFGDNYENKVKELQGTQKIMNIDKNKFDDTITVRGGTPLYTGVLFELEAARRYGADLRAQEYDCSAVIFIGTDGWENTSLPTHNPQKIKETIQDIRKNEQDLISITTILVGFGITSQSDINKLDTFKDAAELDEFINIKDISPNSMAKLAGLISQSFSTASKNITSTNNSSIIQI